MKFLKNLFSRREADKAAGEENGSQPPLAGPDVEHILAEAVRLQQTGNDEAAIAWLEDHAFEHYTDNDPRPLTCLYELYKDKGDLTAAREILSIMNGKFPDAVEVSVASGNFQLLLHNFKQAEQDFNAALEVNPEYLPAHLGLIRVLRARDRFAEELAACQRALRFAPNASELRQQEISALYYNGLYREALEKMETGNRPTAGNGFDVLHYACLFYLGHFDEAERVLEIALQRTPSDPMLHYGKALLRLIRHDFASGWQEYRYRIQNEPGSMRILPFPEWQGGPLTGKRIVIAQEQGMGDQIMFASCLPDLLARQPEKVYLEANERLASLFQRSFPDIQVISARQVQHFDWLDQAHDADLYIQAGNLPGIFRNHLADFPRHHGYLVADPVRQDYWRQQLQSRRGQLKIGFAWKGGTEKTRSFLRSLTPPDIATLFTAVDATWVCLQYGSTAGETGELGSPDNGATLVFPENVGQDMDDFAALVSVLDLVITPCNTTVHVAGALGIPCRVLTPKIPEWRYGLTEAMPWYPSVRLIRQPEEGDWAHVLSHLFDMLTALKNNKNENKV